MPEDAIRTGRGDTAKDYEEYIAELETELSDAKQSNAALRERVNTQEAELDRERTLRKVTEEESAHFISELVTQDAITAWAMGFE